MRFANKRRNTERRAGGSGIGEGTVEECELKLKAGDEECHERVREEEAEEEVFEYDQVYGLVDSDEENKVRAGKYKGRRKHQENVLMKPTSEDYGTECVKRLKKYSKHARTKSTEQFFDKGHLHIEL